MLNRLANIVANLVFPPVCELCQALCTNKPYNALCLKCSAALPMLQGPFCICGKPVSVKNTRCSDCHREKFHFDGVVACHPYQGNVQKLMHAYKYRGKKMLRKAFAARMNSHLSDSGTMYDVIVPVPMDKKKMVSRGFNPAALLAKEISKSSGKPLAKNAMKRLKSGPSQSWLDKKNRIQNIHGSFKLQHKKLTGARVLLVDDIVTTGQTTSECARILKEGGAQTVTVLACARGLGQ